MKNKLKDAVKDAMRAKDKVKLETIRGALAVIQYEEMQKGTENLPEEAIVAILKSEIKKRREELDFADKANRPELKDKLMLELAAIEAFLPKQMSAEQIEKILVDLKTATPGINLGLVMKTLKESYNGQYDGKVASEVAKKVLGLVVS